MVELGAYDAFIFDLDGTLIDSEKYHVAAFGRAMKELVGYDLTPEDEAEFTGNTSVWLAGRLREKHGLDLIPEEVAARKFECLYQGFRTELIPGAAEFVRRHAGSVRMGVASNSPEHFVSRALSESGLASCIDTVVTIDDVSRRKPDPEMIELCLERLGLPAVSVLVFEDSPVGITAALRAGCRAVFINTGLLPLPADLPAGVAIRTWSDLLGCPLEEPS